MDIVVTQRFSTRDILNLHLKYSDLFSVKRVPENVDNRQPGPNTCTERNIPPFSKS